MDKKKDLITQLKGISETYRSLSPLATGVMVIIMLFLATYITSRLAPLHKNISDLSFDVKQITARYNYPMTFATSDRMIFSLIYVF